MPATVVTVRQFVQRFPEFRETDRVLIDACLLEAEAQVGADAWGDKRHHGVGYLAAHILSCRPTSEKARLVKDGTSTVYEKTYRRMLSQVASGFRVVGETVE